MANWAVPARPDEGAVAELAYPAGEVDAWAEAVGADGSRLRASLACASERVARAEGQIRLAAAAREAIDTAAAQAAAKLGPVGNHQSEGLLDEARVGALAVLASACRKIAELYSTTTGTPRLEARYVPSHPVPEPMTSWTGLDLQRAYLAHDADRYMEAVRSSVDEPRAELEAVTARAEEAEDRLFSIGEVSPVRSGTGDIDGASTSGPPAQVPAEDAVDGLLPAIGRDALEILGVGRQAIGAMYRQAEADLAGAAAHPWAGEQQPA